MTADLDMLAEDARSMLLDHGIDVVADTIRGHLPAFLTTITADHDEPRWPEPGYGCQTCGPLEYCPDDHAIQHAEREPDEPAHDEATTTERIDDRDAWPQVDPDGARVRTEGADLTIVVLWSSGATEAMTAAQLVVRLHHQWAARQAGNAPAHIDQAYIRHDAVLHEATIHERVERDGETTVTVEQYGPEPGIVAAGTYPTPGAIAEQPF